MGVATGCTVERTRQERRSDRQHILHALVALVRQICVPRDYPNDSRAINNLKAPN
jgi:hypothetical protein